MPNGAPENATTEEREVTRGGWTIQTRLVSEAAQEWIAKTAGGGAGVPEVCWLVGRVVPGRRRGEVVEVLSDV